MNRAGTKSIFPSSIQSTAAERGVKQETTSAKEPGPSMSVTLSVDKDVPCPACSMTPITASRSHHKRITSTLNVSAVIATV